MKFPDKFNDNAVIPYHQLTAVRETGYSSELPYHMEQLVYFIRARLSPGGDKALKILDGTAHVGGFSLVWATKFPHDKITAVELDPRAYEALEANIATLGLTNITAINSDINTVINQSNPNEYDFIYIDPPWGGPEYYKTPSLQLYLSRKPVFQVINNILSRSVTNFVFVKVPTNFAFPTLHFRFSVDSILPPPSRGSQKPAYLLVSISNSFKPKQQQPSKPKQQPSKPKQQPSKPKQQPQSKPKQQPQSKPKQQPSKPKQQPQSKPKQQSSKPRMIKVKLPTPTAPPTKIKINLNKAKLT